MFRDNTVVYSFRGPFGVRVDIGQSILFLALLYIGFSLGNAGDLMWSASVLAMLVFSIFLHEIGHAWGCLVQGIPVRRVMLYGGGGWCEPARSATRYQNELIVAMGPIVNLVLWAVASLVANSIAADPFTGSSLAWQLWPYLNTFAGLNLALALFNLIPVEPLDGGKLFYLGLCRIMPRRKAAKISAGIGLVAAILWWPALVLFYLSTGWFLLFAPSIRRNWDALRA